MNLIQPRRQFAEHGTEKGHFPADISALQLNQVDSTLPQAAAQRILSDLNMKALHTVIHLPIHLLPTTMHVVA